MNVHQIDFEEIIFLEWWMQGNSKKVMSRYPKIGHKIIEILGHTSTATLSAGVAEEFVLCSLITLYTGISKNYELWFALMIAFILHLVIHFLEAVVYRGYVLGAATSAIVILVCLYILNKVYNQVTLKNMIPWCAFGILIMYINLLLIHRFYKSRSNKN